MKIILSVDWEGRSIDDYNISAMQSFREDFPDVKILHFLNAAYFTKPDARPRIFAEKIHSVVLPGDEHGLHIHGWKRLFEASGVEYKAYPKWTPPRYHRRSESECPYDCGHEVPISTYSQEELQKVIKTSIKILRQYGFDHPKSFRAGGWMAAPHVLAALKEENFEMDSSAVPHQLFRDQLRDYKIPEWTRDLWPNTLTTTQPYLLDQGLWEFPDNGHLADYVTGQEMFYIYKKNVRLLKNSNTDVYLSIGFHHESAARFLPRIRKAINLIKSWSKINNVPVEFTTFKEMIGGNVM